MLGALSRGWTQSACEQALVWPRLVWTGLAGEQALVRGAPPRGWAASGCVWALV